MLKHIKGNSTEDKIASMDAIIDSFFLKKGSITSAPHTRHENAIHGFGVLKQDTILYTMGAVLHRVFKVSSLYMFAKPHVQKGTKIKAELFILNEDGNEQSIAITLTEKVPFQYPNTMELPEKSMIYAKISVSEGTLTEDTLIWLTLTGD